MRSLVNLHLFSRRTRCQVCCMICSKRRSLLSGRLCHEKDQSLKDKDDAVEMLAKKIDTLTKAMESEAKKMGRDVAAMEKEVVAMRLEKEQDTKARRFGSSSTSASQMPPGRTLPRSGSARNM
ncbi:hypothetical protein VPH35_041032 [Triticum aestivum]